MKEICKLTPRLMAIAQKVEPGARLADIGTDHGLLPVFLLQQGWLRSAVASDLRKGPLARAAATAARYGMSERMSLRLGPGLSTVTPRECDTVVLAGMGGETIQAILEEAGWPEKGGHTLLLQPMTMAKHLRHYLFSKGYRILEETVCMDSGRIYTVMKAVGGFLPKEVSLHQCSVSRALLQDGQCGIYLAEQLRRERKALEGLQKAAAPDAGQMALQQKTVDFLTEKLQEAAWNENR